MGTGIFCLIFSLLSLAVWAEQPTAVDRLFQTPSIQSPHLDEYREELLNPQPLSPELLAEIAWKWPSRELLDQLQARFENYSGNSKLKLQLDVRQVTHHKHGRGLLLLGILYLPSEKETGHSVGMFARSFRRHPSQQLEVWGDGLRLDHRFEQTKKIIFPLLEYLESIYRELAVARERLVADWRGRYYWTLAPYEFDPDYLFIEQSRAGARSLDQLSAVRRAFLRFIAYYELPLLELKIRNTDGTVRSVTSIDDFNSVKDFINVFHPTRLLSVRTLTEISTIVEMSKPLPIGQAFALSDYEPIQGAGDTNLLSCSGLMAYSNRVMPAWRAIRTFK